MEARLRVRRFDPESSDGPRYQSYALEVPDYATVLDTLLQIRDEVDGSLALRCSCRSAICGSCAMRINGQARLACKTKILGMAPNGEEVLVEPMGNMPVIKDLVTDMESFWGKIQAVEPWLQPKGPAPQREYLVPHEPMRHLADVMGCIMCGACVSDCATLETELGLGKPAAQTFLGPAALAKAYRFVGDPRDGADGDRLLALSRAEGIWDCTRCHICVEVCPKGVAPLEHILTLRRKAIEAGYEENLGARHTLEFEKTVRESSWL
ncbi:MAG: succinate dehydrogenase iron-sulfur subunit [Chloroflexota bacterium]|nr:succinate dehydrogenase iron-sulfur subunit [Chloroflexota bacterium]